VSAQDRLGRIRIASPASLNDRKMIGGLDPIRSTPIRRNRRSAIPL
jgi:hypothetical protein